MLTCEVNDQLRNNYNLSNLICDDIFTIAIFPFLIRYDTNNIRCISKRMKLLSSQTLLKKVIVSNLVSNVCKICSADINKMGKEKIIIVNCDHV